MSQTTHRFHSFETLVRAQEWLEKIGIAPDQIEVSGSGVPSLTVHTEFARISEVEMIINAAELNDPSGWPALDATDLPSQVIEVVPDPSPTETNQTTPIGWHPTD